MTELTVNIDVDDLEEGSRFYREAFALHEGRRFGAFAIELLGGSSKVYLLRKEAGSASSATGQERSYGRHWTPVHLDFLVDDLDAAALRAERAGAIREGATLERKWGRLAQFADPFGHGLCLIQFLGRGYDEVATLD